MQQKLTTYINSILTKPSYTFLFSAILGILIFTLSYNNGMFWDNVLFASKMGNHLFHNGIFNWTIPDSFDPGHPPFLGFLLAIGWKILGHKLWVAHLVILPFTIGFFYQLFKFIGYFTSKKVYQFLAFLLVIIDPTLSTQFVIVNPEILILFAFFLVLNGVLFNKKWIKFCGLLLLSIISYRSMILFAGIFLFDVINKLIINKEKIKSVIHLKFLVNYFLASTPAILFVLWRLTTKGWLQTHPNSPWSSLWKRVDFEHFIKNCALLIHKYIDFGRVFIFGFIVISFILFGKKILKQKKNKQLLLLAIVSILFIVIISLISTNTFGHRYFIVSFISFNLLSFLILIQFKIKKILYCFLFIGLLTGNLWIYPKEVSQGWDATLAHLPYHKLRNEAINYMNSNNIKIEETASFFPNYNTINEIDLNGDKRAFQIFNFNNKYVFYSNVYNLSDDEYTALDKNYTLLKEFTRHNITIHILIKNDTIRR